MRLEQKKTHGVEWSDRKPLPLSRFVGRVTSIGLTVGCEVQVLQNVRKRPVLVYGRDSVIAVDAEDCARIDVQVRS